MFPFFRACGNCVCSVANLSGELISVSCCGFLACMVLLGTFCLVYLFDVCLPIRLYKSFAREPWLNGSPRACTWVAQGRVRGAKIACARKVENEEF